MKDKRIEYIETDPDIFVELNPGWRLDDAHCFGADSLAEVKQTMKRVEPCECEECRSHKEGALAAEYQRGYNDGVADECESRSYDE